ncbi:MAG: ABC transporter permease [Planctomycetaceae bacterium]|nr:ABC transporter permease [Planctomycetaceae bacterium]
MSAVSDAVDVKKLAEARPALVLPAVSLARRELVRFLRQRTRIVGALGQPLIFWILFGTGLRGSFQAPGGVSFQEYFVPGVAVMIVLFTAIFSTISIIEDRREGFLQGVLVAPVPRLAIVLGKLLGGMLLAVLQAVAFLLIGPLLSLTGLTEPMSTGLTLSNAVPVLLYLGWLGLTLTALGYLIAWPLDSTHGFHAIMSVFLLPMWLLSGAFFPAEGAGWIGWIIRANPLTYGVAGLRRLMVTDGAAVANLPSLPACLVVTGLFGLVCIAAAVALTNRRSAHNVR